MSVRIALTIPASAPLKGPLSRCADTSSTVAAWLAAISRYRAPHVDRLTNTRLASWMLPRIPWDATPATMKQFAPGLWDPDRDAGRSPLPGARPVHHSQINPSASVASATRVKPAMLAPAK